MNEIPKWFTGEIYKKGRYVTNRLSGEGIELNNIELSLYDFIIGFSFTLSLIYEGEEREEAISRLHLEKLNKEFLRARDWFMKNNIKAYYILID